mgnify:CR=1 FL=1
MECVDDVVNMPTICKKEDVPHVDSARQKRLKHTTGRNLDNKVIFSERDKY